MKIAVTGANGFVGRHVLPLLIDKGFEVVAIVRNASKYAELGKQYQLIEHEIGMQDDHLFSKLGEPDILLHLAWGGLSNYKSLHHIDIELPVHYQFIQQMVKSGVQSVAVLGTCFEYGMQSGQLSENLEARPNNPYGYAKDALRKQLQFLQQEYDFMLNWMRLFYVYGEDQPENTLYSQLCAAVERGDSTFNMSRGEQLRDYLHIDEVAYRIVSILSVKQDIGIINVCNGVPISVRGIVEKWISKNNWDILLNLGFFPYPDYEPMAFWGDDRKFSSITNNNIVEGNQY